MARPYEVVVAPRLMEQLEELGMVEQAGKQLTGSLFPYRRFRVGLYGFVYKVVADSDTPEVHFLYCGLRKEGSRKDVCERLHRALRRGEL